ncbi:MAG: CDF family Co(II)/Ni(II) efflux transporter DmeF [Magnetococcales bacterium]|nr:CDF family Co(II)/Ni(II) efflux transporter DmeF [Magnetococcales bacterium]
MHIHTLERWHHTHAFHAESQSGERRLRQVILLTAVTMAVEIAAGYGFGSMALLADGWHMGTHVAALSMALFVSRFTRSHADDARFSFGTGKVAFLGGFASAVALVVVAALMGLESVERLFVPRAIQFDAALPVAVLGLLVNLLSAVLLRDDGDEHHHHADGHHHHADGHHHHPAGHHHHDGFGADAPHDPNHQAAYLHVLADALTSLLAIGALLAGKILGWTWLDPLLGIVGALVIGHWGAGLLRQTGAVLLDRVPDTALARTIRERIEADADNRVADLHLWRVGGTHHAVILSLVTHSPRPPEHYKNLLAELPSIAHLTVEVNGCAGPSCVDRSPAYDRLEAGREVTCASTS